MTDGTGGDPDLKPGARPVITGMGRRPHGVGLHALPGRRAATVAVVLCVLCLTAWVAGILP